MSIAALLSWLIVTLNPSMATAPLDDPSASAPPAGIYGTERQPRDGATDDSADDSAADPQQTVKPWDTHFSISNGF